MTVVSPNGVKFCPNCGTLSTVHDARVTGKGHVRRRRMCTNVVCAYRYTTLEVLVTDLEAVTESKELMKDLAAAQALIGNVLAAYRVSHTDDIERKTGSDLGGSKGSSPV